MSRGVEPYLFVGGPFHGSFFAVPVDANYWRIALPQPPPLAAQYNISVSSFLETADYERLRFFVDKDIFFYKK